MLRIMASRLTPLLSSGAPLSSSHHMRTFITGAALHKLLEIPVCQMLLQEARFQRPGMCLQDHFHIFDTMLRSLAPVRPDQENCVETASKKSEYKKMGFPEGLWQTNELRAGSAENVCRAVKEHGPALMLHYGIGDGYPEHHVVIICATFEIDGRPHAVLFDTNDQAQNPAADRARKFLPSCYELHQLSAKSRDRANVRESFFRVADIDEMLKRGEAALDKLKSERHNEACHVGYYDPPMPPTLYVLGEGRLDANLLERLMPEDSLEKFGALMSNCKDQIEFSPK